jgi:hypothetical protein
VGSCAYEHSHTFFGQPEFSGYPRKEQVVRDWTRVVGNRDHDPGWASLLERNFERFRSDIDQGPASKRFSHSFLEGALSILQSGGVRRKEYFGFESWDIQGQDITMLTVGKPD